ncbi:uncharacterized protein HMPREF1541_10015 [Cyphellophora europaea CBS 101466]|uniref:Bacteriophage T5 Orf172 DNA-binding domain-containing protein n=1 Tax=Cyphellophora europaea (strain CBS 101466) TaxID=1220924 RepID=W2SAT7_CYPE1|nr:uncharacterized protein HMPREF1541_10015 [Cyphellophora europaea CBS 101466]ETN45138.1 hypothetical protein HMPREF1541_10015 [Cyphellophora europaea CBS 101466]
MTLSTENPGETSSIHQAVRACVRSCLCRNHKGVSWIDAGCKQWINELAVALEECWQAQKADGWAQHEAQWGHCITDCLWCTTRGKGQPWLPGAFLDDPCMSAIPSAYTEKFQVRSELVLKYFASPRRASALRNSVSVNQLNDWEVVPITHELTSQIGSIIDLRRMVTTEISSSEVSNGHIYAFRCPDDTKHIKIGWTRTTVVERLYSTRQRCKISTKLLFETKTAIPNARRIEDLIHWELQSRGFRRRNNQCKKRQEAETCKAVHGEWFEIDPECAKKAIAFWVAWVQWFKPYGEDRLLSIDMAKEMSHPAESASETIERWRAIMKKPLAGRGPQVLVSTIRSYVTEQSDLSEDDLTPTADSPRARRWSSSSSGDRAHKTPPRQTAARPPTSQPLRLRYQSTPPTAPTPAAQSCSSSSSSTPNSVFSNASTASSTATDPGDYISIIPSRLSHEFAASPAGCASPTPSSRRASASKRAATERKVSTGPVTTEQNDSPGLDGTGSGSSSHASDSPTRKPRKPRRSRGEAVAG